MVGLISEWFIGLRKYSGWNCFLVIHINDLRPGISYFNQNHEEATESNFVLFKCSSTQQWCRAPPAARKAGSLCNWGELTGGPDRL